MTNFTVQAGKTGVFTFTPVDAAGNPTSANGLKNLRFTSSRPDVFTVAPHDGFPDQILVTGVLADAVGLLSTPTILTIIADDENGKTIYTSFGVTVTPVFLNPTTGFIGTFTA